jgi:hypothetical protein
MIDARADVLSASLAPYERDEEDKAVAAIASMFGGFRSMRQGDEDAAAVLYGVRRVLASFPLWAIERGCLMIQSGEAMLAGKKLDRRFAPNDSEIYLVVKEIVKPYKLALEKAHALLAAPVEKADIRE